MLCYGWITMLQQRSIMQKTSDKFHELYLQFSTIHLNLTLALGKEISICSVFLLHNNSNNANPLVNRQRKFASHGSIYGGKLPWSCFFFPSITQPTHPWAIFSWLTGSKSISSTMPCFPEKKKKKKQGLVGEASELARNSLVSTNMMKGLSRKWHKQEKILDAVWRDKSV